MRNGLIIGFILLAFTSCYKVKKPNKPENLIPKDKMVSILIDMSIMSSAKGVNKKLLENNGIVPEAYIYEKHEIDSTMFAESNSYYAFDIETFDDIYKKVHDSLTVLRDKYKAIEAKEKKEKEKIDSARRAKIKAEKLLKKKNEKNRTKPKQTTKKDLIPLKTN